MQLTEQHEQLRDSVVRFVQNEINPFVDEWEKAEEFPSHEVFKKLGALGVLGVKYDEAYGGLGLDFSYSAVVAEALGVCSCGGVPMAIGVQSDMATPALHRFGSEDLKRNWLAPTTAVGNVRNDMYLASEALRWLLKDNKLNLTPEEMSAFKAYKASLDDATRFIPLWVKVAVAIALGLGTMIGWKRIVVTVGEKIGKQHLTYAQGASAELVAMSTIFAADAYGLPVSTTHVLSSGVAGTMAANGSGLQMATVRNLLMAWVLTLPMAMLISGSLFYLFTRIF